MKVVVKKAAASAEPKAEEIRVTGEFIRLEALMKLSGAIATGGEAKTVIQAGGVMVNGEICTMRGKKLRTGDEASYRGRLLRVVAEG